MKKIERREKKKEKVEFLDSGFYDFCSKNFLLIYSIICILNIVLLFLQFKSITNIVIAVAPILIDILYYVLFKNETSDLKQKVGYILFRISILISVLLLFNHFIISYAITEFSSKFDNACNVAIFISILLDIAIDF